MPTRLHRQAAAALAGLLASLTMTGLGVAPVLASSVNLLVQNTSTWKESLFPALHIVGEVVDADSVSARGILVTCSLTLQGTVIATHTSSIPIEILQPALSGNPAERSPFDIQIQSPPSTWDAYACSAAGGPTTTEPDHRFSTLVTGGYTDLYGVRHVTGTVTNNSTVPVSDVQVAVTLKDVSGSVLDMATTIVGGPIASLASSGFDVSRNQPAWDGLSWVAFAEAPVPAVSLPAQVIFADQVVGVVSGSAIVSVNNAGTGPLHVSAATTDNPAEFQVASDGCSGLAIAPGGACAIGVTFTPAAFGPRAGTLSLMDDANGTPHLVPLSGNGLSRAALAVSPANLAFGNQPVGSTTTQSFTVVNTGLDPAFATLTVVAGSDSDYVPSSPCLSVAIPAAGACTVVVSFQPSVEGSRSASLIVTALDGSGNPARNSPQPVQLSGAGTVARIVISPSPITFGSAPLGTLSDAQTVTITDDGSGPLVVGAVLASGDFVLAGNTCAAPVAPQASCQVALKFAPTGLGVRSGTLTVSSNAVAGTQTVPISGTGTAAPNPTPTPTPTPTPAPILPPTGGSSQGYWMAARDGGIFTFGNAHYFGSTGNVRLNQPIRGVARTADDGGYWLVASDGGIFTFGDAHYFGSTGNLHLNQPIVGMAATPDGKGYWLVASDGGVFTFGDASYLGSTGNIHLNQPIVGMAATPDGKGYWLVASDGGIFTFGNAGYHGSTGNLRLNRPIVGMAAAPDGKGYWLVASDGGIFTFGDSGYFGSTGSLRLNQPIVGMTPTQDGKGYRFVASDGGLFTFGDASYLGSMGGVPLSQPVVALAAT